jgi:phage repressor protein C with HTH and peptisase S24 domain
MNIGRRLKEERNLKGLSQQQLADAVGIKQSAISQLESGASQKTTYAAAIAAKLGVNALWLETGRGPKNSGVSEPQSPSEDEYFLVPILDVHAACGNGHFNDQALVEGGFALPKVMLHDLGVPEGQGRIIHAKGNSMAPTIQDGAVVLINLADKEPMMSKVYAVCLPHEGLVLKRLTYEYIEAAGTSVWMMKSDNPDKNQHPDRRLPPDESTIIVGRAVWYGNRL